jgi:hypothetical protein
MEYQDDLSFIFFNSTKIFFSQGSVGELCVPEEELPACAEEALGDGSIAYNARTVTDSSEVLEVLKAAWAGKVL